MRAMIAAAIVPLLAAGCGESINTAACDLTKLGVQIESWPNEEARTKAKEHLALAVDAQSKKDDTACETHKKEAEAALKL